MPDARNLGNGTVPIEEPRGVWLAYYDDWSGMATFYRELECMRYAVEHSMSAAFVEFGQNLRDAVRRP